MVICGRRSRFVTPAAPIVGISYAPDGTGYWAAGADGGIFAFNQSATVGTSLVTTGHAGYFGSVPAEIGLSGIPLPTNVVGIAPSL